MKKINEEKIDETTMDRLHKKGLISDPMNKKKSVFLSNEALQISKSFFENHFLINES